MRDAAAVLNAYEQQRDFDGATAARGRYGFSNVNDRWVGRDMVGIDAGAAVLALDNYLADDRVRAVFQELPCVRQGLQRLGFTAAGRAHPENVPEQPPARRAS